MTISRFRPKVGDLVESRDHDRLVFQVLSVTDTGMAQLRVFIVSKQIQIGTVMSVPSSRLFPFKEDASQAAARIVREATE
jgi:hypothetical protein